MKALTIRQPHAEMIMLGRKRIENRSWKTNVRGWIGIHAGKSKAELKPFEKEMDYLPGVMEFGSLVGFAEIVNCLTIAEVRKRKTLFHDQAIFATGPYCFILGEVQRLLEVPIEMPGKQGFFEIPDEYFDLPTEPAGPRCRVCGCTQNNACEGGCSWIEWDLCSSCRGAK
jgi:hypothetical protein